MSYPWATSESHIMIKTRQSASMRAHMPPNARFETCFCHVLPLGGTTQSAVTFKCMQHRRNGRRFIPHFQTGFLCTNFIHGELKYNTKGTKSFNKGGELRPSPEQLTVAEQKRLSAGCIAGASQVRVKRENKGSNWSWLCSHLSESECVIVSEESIARGWEAAIRQGSA